MCTVLSCICVSLTTRHGPALLEFGLYSGSLGFGVVVRIGYKALHFLIEYKPIQPIVTTTRRALLLIRDDQFIGNRFSVRFPKNISFLVSLVLHWLPIIFYYRLVVVGEILDVTPDDVRFNHGTYPIVLIHLFGDLSKDFFVFCFSHTGDVMLQE